MSTSQVARRCWAEVDSAALRGNVEALRNHSGGLVQVMAVIKADAYGHGAPGVAAALAGCVEMFAVANVNEAIQITPFAPERPILILGPALSEERGEIVRRGYHVSISNLEEAQAFSLVAQAAGTVCHAHLVLDTGMGRIGIWPGDASAVARQIAALPALRVAGIASHFPSADEDRDFTEKQLEGFIALAGEIRQGIAPTALLHIANSAGALGYQCEPCNLVRAGLLLYGVSPLPEFQRLLRPAMTWKTRVTLVRDVPGGHGISYGRTFIAPHAMRVATLAAGYADGYRRSLSGKGAEVLICGQRCAVLGRVTMDQILVNVTELPGVKVGEEAVLLGRQGAEEISAAELAQKAGTIPWEIFTGLTPRVERIHML